MAAYPLAALRRRLGLTQSELATRLQTTQPHVSAIESKGEPMGRELALRVLDLYRPDLEELGYSLEDLLRGRGGRAA